MRHRKRGRKFGREKDQRKALMKGLATSFFMHGRIATTEAKAKALRPLVEKLITRAKNPAIADKRILSSRLSEKTANVLIEVAKAFSRREGGYTRIIKTGVRRSDSAKMAIIELVK